MFVVSKKAVSRVPVPELECQLYINIKWQIVNTTSKPNPFPKQCAINFTQRLLNYTSQLAPLTGYNLLITYLLIKLILLIIIMHAYTHAQIHPRVYSGLNRSREGRKKQLGG